MYHELNKLKEILNSQIENFSGHYYVPTAWNYFNYPAKANNQTKTLNVNPYDFYKCAIEHIENNSDDVLTDYRLASYYSTMIRTNTTFDHDLSNSIEAVNESGFLETGSFVKMIAYLPTLKKMGINIIYLLPIMQFSQLDRKGELGSVYGVSDFFKLDSALYDPITKGELSLEEQFKAFVQACHLYGMRVILDIIPRTNSVNSSLMINHPDWFYWLDYKDLKDYKPPYVPSLPKNWSISKDNIMDVYASEEVQEHIAKFRQSPDKIDPAKWEQLVQLYNSDSTLEPLDLVREHFDMTIAPAFSDQINDVQPAWSDVTFFRLYLDQPSILNDLNIKTPPNPYILFDTIKGNLFQGEQINQPLWDLLSDILPYYIEKYDLDGARTDMGHALPADLTKLIIKKAKECKSDFYFIAEELSTSVETAIKSKELGYDLIIGDGFYHTHRFDDKLTRDFYYNGMSAPLTIFSAGETHDTPRLISRKGGYKTLQFVSILNLFAYNFVPFMNSGQELLDIQPMNTGIDADKDSAYVLEKDDIFYGKLPLFDKYQFHYENDYEPYIEMMAKISDIKNKYESLLIDEKNVHYVVTPNKEKIIFKYADKDVSLYIVANASLKNTHTFDLHLKDYEVLFSTTQNDTLDLLPLDIKIIIERN